MDGRDLVDHHTTLMACISKINQSDLSHTRKEAKVDFHPNRAFLGPRRHLDGLHEGQVGIISYCDYLSFPVGG